MREGRGDGPTIDWYSIQHLLEYAVPDVVIFLDCCFAASADLRSVDGTLEVLAACGQEIETVGISNWSFTSRLIELLYILKDQTFTIVQLHSRLMNYRAATGPKKLLKTPIHGLMSNKDKASIRLSSMMSKLALSPTVEKEITFAEDAQSLENESSRVLIAVSFERNNLSPDLCRNRLLSHLPGGVTGLSLVRPEGIWDAHSILGLFSLPVAVWDLIPDKPAYNFVGHVITPNIIKKAIASADLASMDLITGALTDPDGW